VERPPPPQSWQAGFPRYGGLQEADVARLEVLTFVAANTQPGEPIYVGLADHRRVFVSELDLYFLADRPGATRVTQFDPGLVNREDIQRQMAAELEARGTRVAILSDRFESVHEPNLSDQPGSGLLNDYFAANFTVVRRAGAYQLLLRRAR
jgi:hypothetical protein